MIAPGHQHLIAIASGKAFEPDWIHYFTLREGKVIRVRAFYDTARMGEAYKG